MKTARFVAWIVMALVGIGCRSQTKPAVSAEPSDGSVVANFFAGADRQYETETQRREIIHALNDMLTKSPHDLRTSHYADYQGDRNAWTLSTLIKRYFVPTHPVPNWTDDTFYRDLPKPASQKEIRKQLALIQKETAAAD